MMVIANAERETRISLVLTEGEAKWLRDYLQNDLSKSESPFDRAVRENMFIALNKALDLERRPL